jgi:hypothetical protein
MTAEAIRISRRRCIAEDGTESLRLTALLPFGLVVWLLYTVIWHAVRRGMREYYSEKVVDDYLAELDIDDDDEVDVPSGQPGS